MTEKQLTWDERELEPPEYTESLKQAAWNKELKRIDGDRMKKNRYDKMTEPVKPYNAFDNRSKSGPWQTPYQSPAVEDDAGRNKRSFSVVEFEFECAWQQRIGAAREREACAKLCDDIGRALDNEWNRGLGVAKDLADTADSCAEAIRMRPNAELTGRGNEEKIEILRAALQRMIIMHSMMMDKTNHGASFYDADCLREMNEAPLQADLALESSHAV
jgi:hypothetical protein